MFLDVVESDIAAGIDGMEFIETDIIAEYGLLLEMILIAYNEDTTNLILDFYYKHHYQQKSKEKRLQIIKDFHILLRENECYIPKHSNVRIQLDEFELKITSTVD